MNPFSAESLGIGKDSDLENDTPAFGGAPEASTEPSDDNPFSSKNLGMTGQAQIEIYSGFLANREVSPDTYAGARRIAKDLGVPVLLGERDPEYVRSQHVVTKARQLLDRYPRLEAFLKDPDKQKLVHDDLVGLQRIGYLIDNLRAEEKATNIFETIQQLPEAIGVMFSKMGANYGEAFVRTGIANAFSQSAAAESAPGMAMAKTILTAIGQEEAAERIIIDPNRYRIDPQGDLAKKFAEKSAKYAKEFAYIQERATTGSFASDAIFMGGTALAGMAPAIGASLLTGMPAVGLTLMASQAGADRYVQARDRGWSVEAAAAEGVFFGLVEAITEKLPLDAILARKAVDSGALFSVLRAMGLEGLQETLVSVIEMGYDRGIVGEEDAFDGAMRKLALAFTVGAGVGGTLRGGAMGLQAGLQAILPDPKASVYEEAVKQLHAEVASVKTTARAPEVMKEALSAMSDGAEVYVNADEMLELQQSGALTMAELEEAGAPEEFIQQLQLGGDVKVSVADLLTLSPKVFEAIAPSVRRDVNSDTAREAALKLEERDQTVARLLSDMQAKIDADSSARPVYTTVFEQLSATGRYTDAQLDNMSTFVAERYEARAANTTKTAEELFLQDNVRIRAGRARVQPTGTLEQAQQGFADPRIPELEQAARDRSEGRITQEQYQAVVDQYKPVLPYESVPEPATDAEMRGALASNKVGRLGKGGEFVGQGVGLRLDIPAYTQKGVWVPTIHNPQGKPVAHEAAARITNATFTEPGDAAETAAGKVGRGEKGKAPFAQINGTLESVDPAELKAAADAALNDPAWTQVGYDPRRHTFFYDRKTQQPVLAADEVIQVGPLVLAKNAQFGDAGTFLFQSAAPLQEQPLTIVGTGPGGRVLNRDIGRAFTDRHMAAYGRALDPEDPADYAIILDSLLADYAEQSRQPDSGDSWYTDDIAEAVRLTEYIYPELANPQFRDLFLTVTALLSPQQKPGPNWENAILALRSWKETGRIDLSKPSGAKFGVNTKGLQLLQYLIDTKGLEGAMRWVQEEHTGREMAEIRRDSGLFVEKPRLGQYTPSELNLKSVTLGIYMFGPKVGDFMQNSVGIDQNAVTVDLWAARSYNRYIGRLLDTPDGDLVSDVRGAKERNQIKRLIRDAAEQAGIDPSAMQAALWYFEQRLYRSHGVKAVSQNFSGAAETALKSRGLEDALRTPVSYQQDAVGDAGKSPSASPARPVATEGERPGRDIRAGAVGRGELGAGQEGVPAAPLQPLPGAPKLNGEQFGPIAELVSVAEAYAEKAGIPYTRQPVYVPITPSRSERIAQAYEEAKHEPRNPDVRRAYRALITQTRAQYDALIDAGYTFTFFDNDSDPYDGIPWSAMRDLRDNKTMAVYSTLAGYGTDQTFDPSEHMLLEDTGLTWKDQNGNDVKVLANDLFRAVHDALGHGLEGAGFRARGEENAWQSHARLFTGEAVKALTTETRGQNSWLNYGPYGERNRTAPLEDTVFANQKMTILPSWVSSEGAVGRYGLPVNEDGTVTLTHFSETEGLTQLDPSYHGTGMAGDEGARKNIEGWVDRSYFGVSVGKEGGYVSEFPAGTPSYEARVPADSLYDYQQDPDGLMATVKDQAITQRRANGDHIYDLGKLNTLYEKAIADAGYEGYFNNAMQGLTVAKFTPTPVAAAGVTPLAQQQEDVTARGSFQQERDTYGNLENIITLMENADLSTFLHEGGHFWLFQMKQDLDSDYLTEEGRARLQKQFDTTVNWFLENSRQAWADIQGMAKAARKTANSNPDDADAQRRAERLEAAVSRAKLGGGAIYMEDVARNFMNGTIENGTDLEVAYHELWARGVEAYLGEGKAPSAELRNAFASFSAWMIGIYKNLRRLNVQLDDNIRGVFDRLVATDEAIAEEVQRDAYKIPDEVRDMANEKELAELQRLAKEAEFEAQQRLQSVVAEEIASMNREEYKAAKAAAEERISDEVYAEPKYAAVELSRRGRLPDGTQLTTSDGKPSKLRMLRDEFVAVFGVDAARAMPRGMFTNKAEDATGIAEFAMLAGFDSQDSMVAELTKPMPRARDLIRQRTNEYMDAQFSELLDPAMVAEKASEIVLSDKRIELAELQARILKRMARPVLLTAAQRRVIEEGAPPAAVDRERIKTAKDLAIGAEPVPEQLDVAAVEAQRAANIPQRRAQSAARRQTISLLRSLDMAAIKQAAAEYVNRAAVKDLTPQRYIAAAERLSRKASKAIASRDYEEAFALLEQKALNLAIAKQARDAQKKVDSIVSRQNRLAKRSDKKLAGSYRLQIFNVARALMDAAGIVSYPVDSLVAVVDAASAEYAKDAPEYASLVGRAQNVATTLEPYNGQYRNMPYSEFLSAVQEIQSIVTEARAAQSMLIEGQRVEHEIIVNEMSAQTADRAPEGEPLGRGTPEQREYISALGTLKAALTRVESWARALDGGRADGPFNTYIVKPVFAALTEYYANRTAPIQKLVEALRPIAGSLKASGKIAAPELDNYVFQNKAELLHAILHTGNESNKQKLLRGGQVDVNTRLKYQWTPTTEASDPLDTSRWDAFMRRMYAEGVITKADMDAVQAIWDIFEETKGAAQKAHFRMHGFYFTEIEPSPVQTPFGTYRGGYAPAITDKMMDVAGGARIDAENLASQQNASMFPGAENGFTKSRVEAFAEPLELDLLRIPGHFDRVMKYAYLGPAIRDVARLVTSQGFRSMINRFSPNAVDQLIVPWLQRTVSQTVTTRGPGQRFTRVLSTISNRIGMQTMAGNIVNAAQQITGLSSAAVIVPPRLLMKHLASFKQDGVGVRTFISQHSAYMDVRFRNGVSDMLENVDNILRDTTVLAKTQAYAQRYAYFAQQAIQNLIDPVVWMAAFDHAHDIGVWQSAYDANQRLGEAEATKKADAAAAYYADSIVRQTQAPMGAAEVSRIETGTPLWRIFVKFYSYFNAMLNLNAAEFDITKRQIGYKGKAGKFFYLYMMGVFVPAVVAEGISMAARGEFDTEDDDDLAVALAELFLLSQIKYVAGFVPGGSAAVNRIIGQFTDVPYDDRLSFSPVLGIFDQAISGTANLVEDIVTAAVEGEPARDASKIIRDGLNAIALILGLPTNWFSKPVQFLQKIEEGEEDPEGVADYVKGFFTGRSQPPKQ